MFIFCKKKYNYHLDLFQAYTHVYSIHILSCDIIYSLSLKTDLLVYLFKNSDIGIADYLINILVLNNELTPRKHGLPFE